MMLLELASFTRCNFHSSDRPLVFKCPALVKVFRQGFLLGLCSVQ